MIGLKPRLDESLLLFALVETNFVIVDGRCDELVLLAEVVLLPLLVPDLEDLLLTGRLVDDARVDRALLLRLVDEVEWVLRLLIAEVIILVNPRDQISPLCMVLVSIILHFFLSGSHLL